MLRERTPSDFGLDAPDLLSHARCLLVSGWSPAEVTTVLAVELTPVLRAVRG